MENVFNETPSHASTRFKRRMVWLLLFAVVVSALASVLIPAWLIQPFRPQTQRSLEVSFALRRWSPLATLCASAIVIALTIWLWRRAGWSRIVLAVALVLSLTATWFARQNHFEWMFNPLQHAAYASVSDASFVGDKDMLMVVSINNEAVAYPIRQMAYHHLVQDTVGGTPLVATY